MKNIDFDNKNCAFNIHDKSIDNEGIEILKKDNINPLTAPYKETISPYKNLRSNLKFKMSEDNNIYSDVIGKVQKEYFELSDEFKISIKELYNLNNKWYYNY